MKKKCKFESCQNQVECPDDPILSRFTLFCPECCQRVSAEQKAKADEFSRQEKLHKWQAICPAGFRDTQIEKLPRPEKAQEILAWNYGKTGVLLHGKTGKGKSRCAWLLCEKVFNSGKSIHVLNSLAGFEYAGIFESGGRAAHEWVQSRCSCGLLFLDDVFKVKLTDSFESAVFAIVDYRLAHQLPILATLNDTGATLMARMSEDRGAALYRRLKEMCEVIQF